MTGQGAIRPGASAVVATGHKPFPASTALLLVPTGSRRAALAALALYPACRARAVAAQRLARAAIRALGPRALPGRPVGWTPPTGKSRWEELARRWSRDLGEFEEIAVVRRSQPDSTGVSVLLLRAGIPVAFVKLRPGRAGSAVEEDALERVCAFGPRTFAVPALRATGSVGEWSYLAMEPLPPVPHRPAGDPPLDAIVTEIGEALADLARPPGTPAGWCPMHGDLTPWNLRRVPGRGLVLLDWEGAGWGPPGADEVLYRASRAALADRAAPVTAHGEAIGYWRETVARRGDSDRDRSLARALDRALSGMRVGPRRAGNS